MRLIDNPLISSIIQPNKQGGKDMSKQKAYHSANIDDGDVSVPFYEYTQGSYYAILGRMRTVSANDIEDVTYKMYSVTDSVK